MCVLERLVSYLYVAVVFKIRASGSHLPLPPRMPLPLQHLHSLQRQQLLMAHSPAEENKKPFNVILKEAAWKASGGGIAGAGAMAVNVCTLMWMRTTVNFQYRYGMGTFEAMQHLYNEGGRGLGGIRRFYQGVGPALFQGPLSRFGDTAANAGSETRAASNQSHIVPTPCRGLLPQLTAPLSAFSFCSDRVVGELGCAPPSAPSMNP